MKRTLVALLAAALVVACGEKKEATQTATPGTQPAATPGGVTPASPEATATAAAAPATAATPAPASNLLTGKVLETFNSGGYTYVRVQTASGEEWAAVNESKVKKGDTVSIAAQMTMEDFKSNSLNRTFKKIVFGTMGGPGGAAPAAPSAMGGGMGGQMPPVAAAGAAAMGTPAQHMKTPDLDVKVEKAAGGSSVAEVWAQKASLKGKDVVVRGKVVKFLGGIMGTNWLHLQDGSGSGANGDNDLTVTTDDVVAVGDVVTVKGTLTTDKDFGAGYRYAVIVEKAKVSK